LITACPVGVSHGQVQELFELVKVTEDGAGLRVTSELHCPKPALFPAASLTVYWTPFVKDGIS